MLADVSLSQILTRVLAIVVLTGLHGFTLAGLAYVLGDRGAKYDGRMTLNPFAHLSIPGLISGVAARATFIRPIAIDPEQMRSGRMGLVICVLGSLALLVAFGIVAMRIRAPVAALVDPRFAPYAVLCLTVLANAAIWSAALNLLPLPPLTGGHLLAAVAPAVEKRLSKHHLWIGIGIAVVMLTTRGLWLQPLISPLKTLL